MVTLSESLLLAIAPGLKGRAAQWLFPLHEAMSGYGILETPSRAGMFLAQVLHESQELSRLVENLNYSAKGLLKTFPRHFPTQQEADAYAGKPEAIANRVYGNRMGNGAEATGDGWRFRGRGLGHLTGRDNYRACSRGIFMKEAILLEHPELLEQPDLAARSFAWFWGTKGLNGVADAGDFERVSRIINGGTHGLTERMRYWNLAKAALGVPA